MREWLVIENSWAYFVFAPRSEKKIMGYIPRDVVEPLLGRNIENGRTTWFTAKDGERMRAHPEWREDEPPAFSSALGFWSYNGPDDAKAVKGEPAVFKAAHPRGESEPARETGLSADSNEMRETAAPPPATHAALSGG